jgi:hypothetical protein
LPWSSFHSIIGYADERRCEETMMMMKTLVKLVTLVDGSASVLVVYPSGVAVVRMDGDACRFSSEAEAMGYLPEVQEVEVWGYVEECGANWAAYTADGDEGLGVFSSREDALDAVVGELEAF